MKQNCFKSGPFSSSFPEWQKKASAAKSAIRSSSGELKLTPKAFGARRKTKLVHENFETSNKSSAEQQRKPPTGIPPLKKSWWRFLLLYRFFSPNSISSLSLSLCMYVLLMLASPDYACSGADGVVFVLKQGPPSSTPQLPVSNDLGPLLLSPGHTNGESCLEL